MSYLHFIKVLNTEVVVSTQGGTITMFRVGEKNIFFPQKVIGDKLRGGCHMCAPWFGSSKMGPKKHGHLRDLKTQLAHGANDFEEMTFVSKGGYSYPWDIWYRTMALVYPDQQLTMRLEIQRMQDGIGSRAPILPAFHPYFACEDASKVKVDVGGSLYKGFSDEARSFPLAGIRQVIITMPDRTIVMDTGGEFVNTKVAHLVFWTDSPSEYFCIEPVLYPQAWFDGPKGVGLKEKECLMIEMSIAVIM